MSGQVRWERANVIISPNDSALHVAVRRAGKAVCDGCDKSATGGFVVYRGDGTIIGYACCLDCATNVVMSNP